MNSPPPTGASSDQLTLFEISRMLLDELKLSNKILLSIQASTIQNGKLLAELLELVAGFTSGGASFSAYQIDPLTSAYIALSGPLIARRLDVDNLELPELLKGATVLSRQVLEELAAYRAERSEIDYLEEQTELINDPWSRNQSPEAEPS